MEPIAFGFLVVLQLPRGINRKEIEEKILVKKVKISRDIYGVNRRRERISGTG
jgi:hypothetical protein